MPIEFEGMNHLCRHCPGHRARNGTSRMGLVRARKCSRPTALGAERSLFCVPEKAAIVLSELAIEGLVTEPHGARLRRLGNGSSCGIQVAPASWMPR